VHDGIRRVAEPGRLVAVGSPRFRPAPDHAERRLGLQRVDRHPAVQVARPDQLVRRPRVFREVAGQLGRVVRIRRDEVVAGRHDVHLLDEAVAPGLGAEVPADRADGVDVVAPLGLAAATGRCRGHRLGLAGAGRDDAGWVGVGGGRGVRRNGWADFGLVHGRLALLVECLANVEKSPEIAGVRLIGAGRGAEDEVADRRGLECVAVAPGPGQQEGRDTGDDRGSEAAPGQRHGSAARAGTLDLETGCQHAVPAIRRTPAVRGQRHSIHGGRSDGQHGRVGRRYLNGVGAVVTGRGHHEHAVRRAQPQGVGQQDVRLPGRRPLAPADGDDVRARRHRRLDRPREVQLGQSQPLVSKHRHDQPAAAGRHPFHRRARSTEDHAGDVRAVQRHQARPGGLPHQRVEHPQLRAREARVRQVDRPVEHRDAHLAQRAGQRRRQITHHWSRLHPGSLLSIVGS
jgi:hypothetical protein